MNRGVPDEDLVIKAANSEKIEADVDGGDAVIQLDGLQFPESFGVDLHQLWISNYIIGHCKIDLKQSSSI